MKKKMQLSQSVVWWSELILPYELKLCEQVNITVSLM